MISIEFNKFWGGELTYFRIQLFRYRSILNFILASYSKCEVVPNPRWRFFYWGDPIFNIYERIGIWLKQIGDKLFWLGSKIYWFGSRRKDDSNKLSGNKL